MKQTSHTQFSLSVRKNYNRLSRIYDRISGSTERKFIHETIGALNIAGSGNFLDIGCGTGTGLLELAEKCPSAQNIIGIDISFGMCQAAAQKMNRQNFHNSPSIYQADGFSLPFASAEFDLVFMSFTFELIPHQLFQQFCSEILRVLKPRGVISIINIMNSTSRNLVFTLYKWGHENYPGLIDCRPIDSGAILESFGLEVISTKTYDLWGIPVASVLASKEKFN